MGVALGGELLEVGVRLGDVLHKLVHTAGNALEPGLELVLCRGVGNKMYVHGK